MHTSLPDPVSRVVQSPWLRSMPRICGRSGMRPEQLGLILDISIAIIGFAPIMGQGSNGPH